MRDQSIGIFDSGVGGLTVLNSLYKLMPNEKYLYFADSWNNPYGNKDKKQLEHICKTIGRFLRSKKVKMIVIACNTATASCLDILRDDLDIPVIGTITSGVEAALEKTENKNIAVCGTNFTIKSNGYLKAFEKALGTDIEKYNITQIPDTNLAREIEKGNENYEVIDNMVKDIIQKTPIETDTIVLGCTHYPIIKDIFAKNFEKNIVDPAGKLAKKVYDFLKSNDLLSTREESVDTIFYTSADIYDFKNVTCKLMNIDENNILKVRF